MTLPSDDRLREIEAGCEGVTPGPWEADSTPTEGEYGSGPNTSSGFDGYQVLAEVRGKQSAICDTINSGYEIVEVAEEYDEESHHAWDEQGRKNMAHIARLDPGTVKAIVSELLELRKAMRMIADIAEGSTTANSLPHIAKIARTALASIKENSNAP